MTTSVCEKVQEMSFCVGSAVCKIFDSQTASSLKKIDLLSEASNLLNSEIKRLSKGEVKTPPTKASPAPTPVAVDSAETSKRKRRTKAEMEALRAPKVEVEKPEEETPSKKTSSKKPPAAKTAPTLPQQDLEEEDLEDEEAYPVGFADEDDVEIEDIDV
jgi:hypothetical protein